MDLDTALLRTFVTLADERHFGRAAARLHISQQAVSKRIARLEASLGSAVIDRTATSFVLSPAGTRLLPKARVIVDGVDEIAADTRPDAGQLRIDVLSEHLAILRFVLDLVADAPETALETVMRQDRVDAVTTLRSGQADAVFGRAGAVGTPWPSDIEHGTPFLEPFGVLIGQGHPWAGRTDIGMAELSGAELWFPMTGAPPEWRALLEEMSDVFSLTIDYAGATMGFDHFVERAKAGDGLSFYGLGMRPPPIPAVDVVPLVDPVPVFPWVPMWRRRLPHEWRSLVESIVDRARAAVAEPDPGDAWMPQSDRAVVQGRPSASRNRA